jgi:hypothetical protein
MIAGSSKQPTNLFLFSTFFKVDFSFFLHNAYQTVSNRTQCSPYFLNSLFRFSKVKVVPIPRYIVFFYTRFLKAQPQLKNAYQRREGWQRKSFM